jgi:hypothetical protein
MALTRDFRETVRARVQRAPAFREALLWEAVEAMLAGDLKAGKAALRDYVNATIGSQASPACEKRGARTAPRG